MIIAPEPYRTACLEVVYMAILEARMLAWGNARLRHRLSKRRQARIADLMDAVHNVPHLVNDWERCDPERLRQYLSDYDEKWARKEGVRLVAVYDGALRDGRRTADELTS
ncbi:MAG: hypothetical protein ACAI43_01020 [Phycisphaerae bacterium]